jgi:glutathione S-transferase
MTHSIIYHIPVCPFCQRLEILLTLKGRSNEIDFRVVDITQPRPDWLLQKTRGTTALPILETADGHIIKESLVILQYLEDIYPERPVAQRDPYRRAVENMLTRMDGEFFTQGYTWLMNQDPGRREALREGMLKQYAQLNDFLLEHAPAGPFLFEEFGWAETVFTPSSSSSGFGITKTSSCPVMSDARACARGSLRRASGCATGDEGRGGQALLRLRQRGGQRRVASGAPVFIACLRTRLAGPSMAAEGQVQTQRDRRGIGVVTQMTGQARKNGGSAGPFIFANPECTGLSSI